MNDQILRPEFITDGAVYVLDKAGIFPCKLRISGGLILKKYNVDMEEYEYRYFYPAQNTQIGPVIVFKQRSFTNKTKIMSEILKDDFTIRLENYRKDLGSGWIFVSVCNLLYNVFRVL